MTPSAQVEPRPPGAYLETARLTLPWVLCILVGSTQRPALAVALAAIATLATLTPILRGRSLGALNDYAVLVGLASATVAVVCSRDLATSLPQFDLGLLCILAYCWMRTLRITYDAVAYCCFGLSVHCILALRQFYLHYVAWESARFLNSNLVDFRAFVTLTRPGVRPGIYDVIYVVGLVVALHAVASRPQSWSLAALYATTAGLCLTCILVSSSRALLWSAALVLAAAVLAQSKPMGIRDRRLWLALLAMAGPVVGIACIVPLREAVLSTAFHWSHLSQARSAEGRMEGIRLAFQALRYSTWHGSGPGTYALEIRDSGLAGQGHVPITTQSFNFFLDAIVCAGWIGGAAVLFGIATATKTLVARRRELGSLVLIAGGAAIAVCAAFEDFVFADAATAIFLALYLALITDSGRDLHIATPARRARQLGVSLAMGALVLSAASLAMAGWFGARSTDGTMARNTVQNGSAMYRDILMWDYYDRFQDGYDYAARFPASRVTLQEYSEAQYDEMGYKFRPRRALELFESLVMQEPSDDGAWSNIAWLRAVSGDTKGAIVAIQRSISIYPDDYTYYVLLAAFTERSGNLAGVRAAYARAIMLYPRLTGSLYWRAFARRHAGEAQGALADAMFGLEQRGDVLAQSAEARLLLDGGSVGGARDLAAKVTTRLPNVSGAWEVLAVSDLRRNDLPGALQDCKRAIFLDPTDPLPRTTLASIEDTIGDHTAAAQLAKQANELNEHARSPAASRRAVLYRRRDGSASGQLPVSLLYETQPHAEMMDGSN